VIYLILWWLIFFITLPFGVKKEINVKFGNDPGAPINANIKKKVIVTTFVTFFLTLIIILLKNEIL
jgi:predicted secreted protein|tara:strand:+ start:816 stop:1013 length:198 start_codon:yes stop_codon:yes gene_type:complete